MPSIRRLIFLLIRNCFIQPDDSRCGYQLRFSPHLVPVLASLGLVLLLVAPVRAAPSLSLGSNANYQLTASVSVSQSCSANPSNYNLIACLGQLPPALVSSPVNITGDSSCTVAGKCVFNPSTVNVAQFNSVTWTNNDGISHTVTTSFTSPASFYFTLSPTQRYSFTFTRSGTYRYFDWSRPWINGTVVVFPSVPPASSAPPPMTQSVALSGPVGWNVLGLDGNAVVLNLTHTLNLSASTGGYTLTTPISESGSSERSVTMSTRVESPGAAPDLVTMLLQAAALALAGAAAPGPVVVPPVAASTSGLSLLQSMQTKPVYTFWWVNGPLANGQPVLVLTGYGSVRGSETVNIGGSLGSRTAWIVGSQLTQSFTAVVPTGPSPASANATSKLSLQFDYDQASDILLKSLGLITFSVSTGTPTNPGSCLYASGSCVDAPVAVVVTRQVSVTVSLSMQLSSTNVPSSSRSFAAEGSSPLSSPWASFGIGIGVAAAAAVAVVGTRALLARRGAKPAAPAEASPATPPTPPSPLSAAPSP